MNPVLDNKIFTADVEARADRNGRLYLYGSQDVYGNHEYCSKAYHVFSTDDMVNFTDHGESFSSEEYLYAPDAIEHNGKYYLYFCTSSGREMVAESEKPEGPFVNPRPVVGADGDGIDPSVMVDDDGKVYYFWGQFELRGGELMDDMCTLKPETVNRCIINERDHFFHEGASIRKRNGIYYLVYTDVSNGRATRMAYATAKHPLGPYTRRGVILDNAGCDPSTWNNHGSIFEYKGQWYIAYHRACFGNHTVRRACVEPIEFDEFGLIREVQMSVGGSEGAVDSQRYIDAWRASRLSGKARSILCKDGREALRFSRPEDRAAYRLVRFSGKEKQIVLDVESASEDCELAVRLGWYEQCGAQCVLKGSNTEGEIKAPQGECIVFLHLLKGEMVLRGFRFE